MAKGVVEGGQHIAALQSWDNNHWLSSQLYLHRYSHMRPCKMCRLNDSFTFPSMFDTLSYLVRIVKYENLVRFTRML